MEFEDLEHYSKCQYYFIDMCKERENKYRICLLPRCCGVCEKIKSCFCACVFLDINTI